MAHKMNTWTAILLVAMMCIGLTACAKDDIDTNENGTSVTDVTTTMETETEKLLPDIPEKDFEEYDFRVLTKGTFNVHWKTRDIYAEQENGDPINDAVFKRNQKIEENYNIKISEFGEADYLAALRKSVLASDDTYDMVSVGYTALTADHFLVNLYDIDYIDLGKPWYDQNANTSLSVLGRLYQTTGDIVVMDNDATWGVLFNKVIANNLNLGDFYQFVRDGKWTGAKLLEFAKQGSKDLNGDGKMHELEDQWGIIGSGFNTIALAAGAGERIIDKDENDKPFIALFTEKYVKCFELSYEMHVDNDYCLYAERYISKYADPWTDCIEKAFVDSRALFNFSGINRVTLFRSMEIDFGILPVPKYDEAQKNYFDIVSCGSSSTVGVPTTAADLERTGIIIEALSAESYYTLTPAYYDISLKTKLSRDNESSEMLDIIFANRVFDLANVYNWGGILTVVDGLTTGRIPGFQSKLDSIKIKVEEDIGKTIDLMNADN